MSDTPSPERERGLAPGNDEPGAPFSGPRPMTVSQSRTYPDPLPNRLDQGTADVHLRFECPVCHTWLTADRIGQYDFPRPWLDQSCPECRTRYRVQSSISITYEPAPAPNAAASEGT